MSKTLDYLKGREWSMGNGQCPECCGLKPGLWYRRKIPHPSAPTKQHEGHIRPCPLAEALEETGAKVQWRSVIGSDDIRG